MCVRSVGVCVGSVGMCVGGVCTWGVSMCGMSMGGDCVWRVGEYVHVCLCVMCVYRYKVVVVPVCYVCVQV